MKNISLFFLLFLLAGCGKEKIEEPIIERINKYLHISHTRASELGVVSEKITNHDFSQYEMLWLGGDIDLNTYSEPEIIQTWDNVFDFKNPNTLWSIGNHDFTSNYDLHIEATGRETFYSYNKDDFTFIVLDTQKDNSNIIEEQLELIQEVADTISESKYLVLLTHKLLWLYNNPELEDLIDIVPNGGSGNCNYCTNPNNFYEDVYPELLTVKEKGIEVFCIAGDLGFKYKEYQHETSEGIHLLASGIDVQEEINKVLVFKVNEDTGTLTWEFEDL